jgi:outer membrane scaffolding protein for murein synthesis (MipA/OmpV family)
MPLLLNISTLNHRALLALGVSITTALALPAFATEPASSVQSIPEEVSQIRLGPTANVAVPETTSLQSVTPPSYGTSGERSRWQISIGLGASYQPEYPGSGKSKVSPLPYLSVTYDHRVFLSTAQGIGVYLWSSPQLQIGTALNIADDTRYFGKDAALRGLQKIKMGGEASIFARYLIGPVSLDLSLQQRIGTVNGLSADFGASYRRQINNWSFAAGPSITYASAKLNDGFFGVTAAEAANARSYGNLISPYHPGAGIRDISLNISARYHLNAHWGIQTQAALGVLVGRDGNSPITKQRFQPELSSFVYYDF